MGYHSAGWVAEGKFLKRKMWPALPANSQPHGGRNPREGALSRWQGVISSGYGSIQFRDAERTRLRRSGRDDVRMAVYFPVKNAHEYRGGIKLRSSVASPRGLMISGGLVFRGERDGDAQVERNSPNRT